MAHSAYKSTAQVHLCFLSRAEGTRANNCISACIINQAFNDRKTVKQNRSKNWDSMHISACFIYHAFNDQHRLHWAPSTKGDNTILNSILIYKYIHGRAQHHWAAKLKLKTRCTIFEATTAWVSNTKSLNIVHCTLCCTACSEIHCGEIHSSLTQSLVRKLLI